MRCAALGLLLASSGCNAVFGLQETRLVDAQPDAKYMQGALYYGIPSVKPDGTPGPVQLMPIPQLAELRVGPPLGQGMPPQFGDDGLVDAPYDSGTFTVPYYLTGPDWRLVYKISASDIPHEIQWNATDPKIVIPRAVPLDATPPPAMSGYAITPTGLATTPGFLSPSIITSGAYTATYLQNSERFMNTVTFQFSSRANPVGGPRAAPQTARHDWLLVLDWKASPLGDPASYGYGWAWTDQVDLTANTNVSPAAAWNAPTTKYLAVQPDPSSPTSARHRINVALSSLDKGLYAAHEMYGYTPSTEIAPFSADASGIEQPMILPISDGRDWVLNLPYVEIDPTKVKLPKVLYASFSSTRMAGAVALVSTMQMMTTGTDVTVFPAAITNSEKLGSVDLAAADGKMVTATTMPVSFTFNTDSAPLVTADDTWVTLFDLTSGALTPVRVYQVFGNAAVIDGNLLQKAHTYVFATTVHAGFPKANAGDLSMLQYPMGSSTKFSGTFTIQ